MLERLYSRVERIITSGKPRVSELGGVSVRKHGGIDGCSVCSRRQFCWNWMFTRLRSWFQLCVVVLFFIYIAASYWNTSKLVNIYAPIGEKWFELRRCTGISLIKRERIKVKYKPHFLWVFSSHMSLSGFLFTVKHANFLHKIWSHRTITI